STRHFVELDLSAPASNECPAVPRKDDVVCRPECLFPATDLGRIFRATFPGLPPGLPPFQGIHVIRQRSVLDYFQCLSQRRAKHGEGGTWLGVVRRFVTEKPGPSLTYGEINREPVPVGSQADEEKPIFEDFATVIVQPHDAVPVQEG